jgi:hypothetical protein
MDKKRQESMRQASATQPSSFSASRSSESGRLSPSACNTQSPVIKSPTMGRQSHRASAVRQARAVAGLANRATSHAKGLVRSPSGADPSPLTATISHPDANMTEQPAVNPAAAAAPAKNLGWPLGNKKFEVLDGKPPDLQELKDPRAEGLRRDDMVSTAAARFLKLRQVKGDDETHDQRAKEEAKFLAMADTDGDGIISEEEMRAMREKMGEGSSGDAPPQEKEEVKEDASRLIFFEKLFFMLDTQACPRPAPTAPTGPPPPARPHACFLRLPRLRPRGS